MQRKVALVAGARGIIGQGILEYLLGRDDWQVIALARRTSDEPSHARFISVSLMRSWPFGESIFRLSNDSISSTTKARLHGFHDVVDTEEMFHRKFAELREGHTFP